MERMVSLPARLPMTLASIPPMARTVPPTMMPRPLFTTTLPLAEISQLTMLSIRTSPQTWTVAFSIYLQTTSCPAVMLPVTLPFIPRPTITEPPAVIWLPSTRPPMVTLPLAFTVKPARTVP